MNYHDDATPAGRFLRYAAKSHAIYDSSHSLSEGDEAYYYEIPASIVDDLVSALLAPEGTEQVSTF